MGPELGNRFVCFCFCRSVLFVNIPNETNFADGPFLKASEWTDGERDGGREGVSESEQSSQKGEDRISCATDEAESGSINSMIQAEQCAGYYAALES